MADYIDREVAKEKLAALVPFVIDESNSQFAEGLTAAYETICAMPSADVKPVVKAHWTNFGAKDFPIWVCSKCTNRGSEETPVCPNCGADMRGNDND